MRIFFDGDLQALAKRLEPVFDVEIDFDTDMDPPHEEFGHANVMACNLWIAQDEPGIYILDFETEEAGGEVMDGRLHDLSPWLVCLVESRLKLKAIPGVFGWPSKSLEEDDED